MQALNDAGCLLTGNATGLYCAKSELRAFTFDATDCPDLFPPLAALASYCGGVSRIKGVSRLEHKESNRAQAITEVLGALNITARVEADEMFIEGGGVRGAVVPSHNDHRIAMMAAVMTLGGRGEVTITGAEAVANHFRTFSMF